MAKGQQYWSKTQERKWRSTFTRDNVQGERLLRYKLRNGETPASLIRKEKADHLAREAREDAAVRAEARWSLIDGIPKMGAAKSGGEYVEAARDLNMELFQSLKGWLRKKACSFGFHEWIDRHRMVQGRAYGMEKACRHCDKTESLY